MRWNDKHEYGWGLSIELGGYFDLDSNINSGEENKISTSFGWRRNMIPMKGCLHMKLFCKFWVVIKHVRPINEHLHRKHRNKKKPKFHSKAEKGGYKLPKLMIIIIIVCFETASYPINSIGWWNSVLFSLARKVSQSKYEIC